ncbi:hypothetical protein [Streptomyces sp. NPDC046939]|uniref:hypothetical protein n=1 Tax=Streptomyces sp. NPDC046939 TaxID=3155376 RepID=UPI0033F2371A
MLIGGRQQAGMTQTLQALNVSSGGDGDCDRERVVLVEQSPVLEAVVALAEHTVEQVALGGIVPVSVGAASSPGVHFGAGEAATAAKGQR